MKTLESRKFFYGNEFLISCKLKIKCQNTRFVEGLEKIKEEDERRAARRAPFRKIEESQQ